MYLKSRKNFIIKKLSFFAVVIFFLTLFVCFLALPAITLAEEVSISGCRLENEDCNLGEGNFCCLGLLCVNEFGLPWSTGKCWKPSSCCPTTTPTPTPVSISTPTPTICVRPTATNTPTPILTATNTPIPSNGPTSTLGPTATLTPTPSGQAVLTIVLEKTNDKQNGANAGDIVQYTLKLTNIDKDLQALTLIDNLPEGFSYQTGSASVNGGNVSSSEPVVTNDGKTMTWNWSFVPASTVVTITYKAKISDSNQAATYTDFAYAKGTSSETPVESNVAKSDVTIGSVFDFSSSIGGTILGASNESNGEVLGAILPATGSENIGFLSAAFFMIGSGIFIKRKVK